MNSKIKRLCMAAIILGTMSISAMGYATAAPGDNIDDLIQQQQQILLNLNEKKNRSQNEEMRNRIEQLQEQLQELKQANKYDSKGAIEALAGQVARLQSQLEQQMTAQNEILERFKQFSESTTKKLNEYAKSRQEGVQNGHDYYGRAATTKYLVNPGQGQQVGYTQDAINAQGNSMMIFTYAPDQLYKIYCRVGYLTDLELKKGEKINFVGGGDTSAWAIDSAEVDGTPHLYIKPTVAASTTNIIVTTNKRSYQLILNTSDWYNPMIRWSYEGEERIANMLQKQKDEIVITNTMHTGNYGDLNFSYQISGSSSLAPVMVFDDGRQTIIKFTSLSKNAPALFVREAGKKSISLINYKIKDNCYIIDRLLSEAELRFSDKEIVRIRRK